MGHNLSVTWLLSFWELLVFFFLRLAFQALWFWNATSLVCFDSWPAHSTVFHWQVMILNGLSLAFESMTIWWCGLELLLSDKGLQPISPNSWVTLLSIDCYTKACCCHERLLPMPCFQSCSWLFVLTPVLPVPVEEHSRSSCCVGLLLVLWASSAWQRVLNYLCTVSK